jgi:putative transposase
MSTREIVAHLRDLYGVEVSPDLISAVTDAVLEEIASWQSRPLEPVYPLVFFDALRVKVRDEGLVRNKAVHIALGVRADGAKEILGLWIEQSWRGHKTVRWTVLPNNGREGLAARHERTARPRRGGHPDRRGRRLEGLSRGDPGRLSRGDGPDPHRPSGSRQSLAFVSCKDRKSVAAALKDIYRAVDAEAGAAVLAAFEAGDWGKRYPAIGQSWRRARGARSSRFMPFPRRCAAFSPPQMPLRR